MGNGMWVGPAYVGMEASDGQHCTGMPRAGSGPLLSCQLQRPRRSPTSGGWLAAWLLLVTRGHTVHPADWPTASVSVA